MKNTVIERLETGPLFVNTYIVYPNGGSSCVVIDPADAEPVRKYAEKHGLNIDAVLVTHCHFDHILGVHDLQQDGAKVYIGEKDADGLKDKSVCFAYNYAFEPTEADVLLKDGDTVSEAGLSFRVITTPGHTRGGVCYVLEENSTIFAGDTLFRFSIGRTDLPGGSIEEILSSIRQKLFTIEGDYDVLPGHGEATTLADERRSNPFAGRGARW